MKLMVKVIHIHHATASSVLNIKIPASIPDTFSIAEKVPQIKRLFVSFAAWKMDPDVDRMICIPTDMDNIWNMGMDGIH